MPAIQGCAKSVNAHKRSMPQGCHENDTGAVLVDVVPVADAGGYDSASAEQRNDDDCVNNANHESTPFMMRPFLSAAG